MTRQEYESKYGVKPVVISDTEFDTTPAPIRMTRAEYNATYRPQTPTFKQDFKQDISETGAAQREALQTGMDRSAEIDARVASGETSKTKGLFQKFGAGLGTASNVLFQTALGGAKAILPESSENKISETLGKDLEKIFAPETRQAFIDKMKESEGGLSVGPDLDNKAGAFLEEVGNAYKNDANFRSDVQAAGGVLEWLSLPGTAKSAVVKTADALGDVASVATPPLAQKLTELKDSVKFTASPDARVKSQANDILKVETKYKTIRDQNAANPKEAEASRTRIAQSNVLEGAVDETGRISTKDAVKAYREQTIDGRESIVRDILKEEGAKINLKELELDMRASLMDSGLEGGALYTALKGIEKQLKGLAVRADAFGDVPLYKLQDAKIGEYKSLDYTKVNQSIYKKTLARVYKEAIEKKSKLNVKEINQELAKFYGDIDRIQNLDGKIVDGGKLGKYGAQIVGTGIGMAGGSMAGSTGAAIGGILGGEIAQRLKGKSMAGTFNRGIEGNIPESKILKDAKAGVKRDLKTPDRPVGIPAGVKATPEMKKVEAQIKRNVILQQKAIKAGDFTLVAVLKDVYENLVAKLKNLLEDYKKNGIPLGLSIRRTITPEQKLQIAKELEAYDSTPLTVNGRIDLSDTDTEFRLQQLKDKNEGGSFTDADAIEARTLLERKGVNFEATAKPKSGDQPREKNGQFGEKPKIKGVADPLLKTKREVVMKDNSGQKFTVPANTVIKPLIADGKTYIKVGSKQYAIPKNQYDNLKGQSDISIATPFAPELKETVETVRKEKARIIESLDKRDFRVFREDQTGTYYVADKNGRRIQSGFDNESDAADWLDTSRDTDRNVGRFIEPKYSQYTLPGGENYREILIQAPETLKKGEYGTDVIDKSQTYRSSHWSEPNVISHIRMNERTIDGKKYAFMEELQSDWAREGRDKGFIDTSKKPEYDSYRKSLENKYNTENYTELRKKMSDGEFNKLTQLGSLIKEGGVPNNPLLKDWQIPTTKRALIEAVDSGADRFAWINGEQTSARYNLATYLDEANWKTENGGNKLIKLDTKNKDDIIIGIDKEGKIVEGQSDWRGKKLDEVLGKGLADKIMEKETGTLSGDGLSFGGEWAKNLYDKQVRDIVKKLTGAEVKTVDMGLSDGKNKATFIKQSGKDVGGILSERDLKVGLEVNKEGTRGDYIITKVIGNGKFEAVNQADITSEVARKLQDFPREMETKVGEMRGIDALKYIESTGKYPAWVKYTWERITTEFDLSSTPQLQQYIDLTPEVKAKIQSKAPKFTMKKQSAAESIPLLLLMIAGGGVAANET